MAEAARLAAPPGHMAYRKRKAEAEITGLERPINEHLLKLLAVDPEAVAPETRRHWAREVSNWLDDVADIRLMPTARPGPARFYSDILFDEPFGGAEVENVGRRLYRIARDGHMLRDDLDPVGAAETLRRFHAAFAAACAEGSATPERIEALVAALAGAAKAPSRRP